MPLARRGFDVILGILAEAMAAGVVMPSRSNWCCRPVSRCGCPSSAMPATESVPPVVVYIGVMGWARIHGMVMLELFGHARFTCQTIRRPSTATRSRACCAASGCIPQ